jgi:hypothetical protein
MQNRSVVSSAFGSVFESVYGSVLESVLRAYLEAYSQAGWEGNQVQLGVYLRVCSEVYSRLA